jgi:hypothetical protein
MRAARDLPLGLVDNRIERYFVYRRGDKGRRPGTYFSYRHRDREEAKKEAVAFTVETNAKLGPSIRASTKGRMTSANTSGEVGVHPARTIVEKDNGNIYEYQSWVSNWPRCPYKGGLKWASLQKTDDGAYVLAVLSRRMESINRNAIIEAMLEAKTTGLYDTILKQKPETQDEDSEQNGARVDT